VITTGWCAAVVHENGVFVDVKKAKCVLQFEQTIQRHWFNCGFARIMVKNRYEKINLQVAQIIC
jgi:hypothetical protein